MYYFFLFVLRKRGSILHVKIPANIYQNKRTMMVLYRSPELTDFAPLYWSCTWAWLDLKCRRCYSEMKSSLILKKHNSECNLEIVSEWYFVYRHLNLLVIWCLNTSTRRLCLMRIYYDIFKNYVLTCEFSLCKSMYNMWAPRIVPFLAPGL